VRRVPIRLKVTAALAAPLVFLLTVVVAQISDTTRRLHQELDQARVAVAAIGPSGLMSGLQDERSWALIELIGQEEQIVFDVRGYGDTRRTDAAIAEFRTQIAASGGIVAEAYQPSIDGLDDLAAIRSDIDANDVPRTLEGNSDFAREVFRRYAALITAFNEGNSRVALAVDDASLRQGAELVDLISRHIETNIQLEIDIVDSALPPDPGVSRDEIRAIAMSADRFRRGVAAITTGARGRYRHLVEEATPTEWNERALAAADHAALRGEVDIGRVLSDAGLPEAQTYLGLRERIADQLDSAADDLAASARARVLLLQALGVLAMAVAGLAVWRVSRSITRPLHALTRQAVVVANERLPGHHHVGRGVDRRGADRRGCGGVAGARIPPVVDAAIEWFRPATVVVDQYAPAGAAATERCGLPWATVVPTSAGIADPLEDVPAIARQLRHRKRLFLRDAGLDEIAAVRVDPQSSPHLVVAFTTEALAGPVPDSFGPCCLAGPCVARPHLDVAVDWERLDDGRPLIVTVLENPHRQRGADFYAIAARAAMALEIRTVIVGPPDLVPRPFGNVVVAPRVLLRQLLRGAAGVVCDAGHTVACEALDQGGSLIVVPVTADRGSWPPRPFAPTPPSGRPALTTPPMGSIRVGWAGRSRPSSPTPPCATAPSGCGTPSPGPAGPPSRPTTSKRCSGHPRPHRARRDGVLYRRGNGHRDDPCRVARCRSALPRQRRAGRRRSLADLRRGR
jgi:hypothetical protein